MDFCASIINSTWLLDTARSKMSAPTIIFCFTQIDWLRAKGHITLDNKCSFLLLQAPAKDLDVGHDKRWCKPCSSQAVEMNTLHTGPKHLHWRFLLPWLVVAWGRVLSWKSHCGGRVRPPFTCTRALSKPRLPWEHLQKENYVGKFGHGAPKWHTDSLYIKPQAVFISC